MLHSPRHTHTHEAHMHTYRCADTQVSHACLCEDAGDWFTWTCNWSCSQEPILPTSSILDPEEISRASAMFGMALKCKNAYNVYMWYKCAHSMCTHPYTWICTHMHICENLIHCLTGKAIGCYSWDCSSPCTCELSKLSKRMHWRDLL